jgi:hypothetical protein
MNGTRPVLSFSSRIIKAKQDEQMMNQHKKRMSRIKASVDNQRPRSMRSARRVNRKKEQMDRDRQMEIEAANHLLIARILDESHADRKLRRAVYGEPRRTTRTLNTTTRRKELDRINKANKVLLNRIISTRSTMRRDVWEASAEDHDATLRRLAQNSIHNKRRPGSRGSSRGGTRPGTAGSTKSARGGRRAGRPGTAGSSSKRAGGRGRGGRQRPGSGARGAKTQQAGAAQDS